MENATSDTQLWYNEFATIPLCKLRLKYIKEDEMTHVYCRYNSRLTI